MGKMRMLSNVINHASNQVEGFCFIKSLQLKVNVKGAEYLDIMLADADGEINAKLWDYQSAVHGMYSAGEVIKVRGTINLYKDTEQLKIDRIRHITEADHVDMSSIVASAPIDGKKIFDSLFEFAGSFADADIAKLTQYLLTENRERMLYYPAALKLHHAHRGGLMYHTSTMLDTAKQVVSVYGAIYPELCSDLVYAGVILHDIAKTQELEVGTVGLATAYTTEGQLLGHISMGMAMINNAAKKLNIPRETAMLLEHIMLSHHGVPEYGSPQMPMFPEAEIVSAIDTLDARLFEMFDALSAVNTGEFTDRQWALDNRRLYRHGHKFSKESGGFQSGAGTADGQPAAAAEDDSLAAKLSSLAGKFNSIKS